MKHALRRTGRTAFGVCAFFGLDYHQALQMGEPTPPVPAGEERGAIESEHLAAIVRSSDDAILSKDRNAIITSWNEGARRLYGYTAEEVIGRSVALLIPPERQGEELEIVEKIFSGDRVEHYETERVRKDGVRVSVSLTASPIHGPDGEIVGVSTQARNISATQRALQHAEQQLNGAPVGIAVISLSPDSFGQLLSANPEMTRLLGYSAAELTSLKPGELTHPDDAQRERALYEELAAGRRTSFALEKRDRRKDGRWIWVWLTVSILEAEDPPRTALAHLLDLSDRKAAEAELEHTRLNLERSNAELDQFAYVASHDLKEPLILLSAYARMLSERHEDNLDEEGRQFLGYVRQEAARMKSMIDDLLDYSRLQTAAQEASRVELGEAVAAALRTLGPRIEETGATVDVESSLPVVEGSPAQFERLFRNLIGNALKFRSEHPPVVSVSAEKADGECIIAVRDNGIGVDPAKAGRIFEVFQRLHSQDAYAGTGMGLAICKRIVERHGGRIWVDPGADGGSVFKFALPV